MNLNELSRAILSLSQTPISKIRFARIIYFIHKELIRKGFMKPDDIIYRRAPLGPVPEALPSLTLNTNHIILKQSDSPLSYANESYTIANNTNEDQETLLLEQYRDILSVIDRTLQALAPYNTSELIEASHDPSWQQHYNGSDYTITQADLKNNFPFNLLHKPRPKKSPANDLGQIQANLLRGMLADIVKESTGLEYPDDPNTNTPPSPESPPILTIKIITNLPKKSLDFLKKLSKKKPDQP